MSEQQDLYRSQPKSPPEKVYEEISFIDLAIALARHKKLIIIAPIITAVAVGMLSFFMPSIYTSKTNILPVGGAVSKETLALLLRSNAMNDSLSQRVRFRQAYGASAAGQIREQLSKSVDITTDGDGHIEIKVDDTIPIRAAAIANAYPEILNALLKNFDLTEATQRRLLLQHQLSDARQAVELAEVEMNRYRHTRGFIEPEAQVRELVEKTTDLRARIAMKELELLQMGTITDPSKKQNYLYAQQELSMLWLELGKVNSNSEISGRVSGKDLVYLGKFRDLIYNQTRYDQLLKAIDAARIEELKSKPMILVLDRAEIPEKKILPKRSSMMMTSALAVGFLAVFWSMLSEALAIAGRDSRNIERLHALKQALKWR